MRNILVSFVLTAATLCAQPFFIVRQAIPGGGGTSTNGSFSVSGTIGIPASGGALAGGKFSLTSGFWSHFVVVEVPGAPPLALSYSGDNAILSWLLPADGFTVESSVDISGAGSWKPISSDPATNNGIVSVTFPITPGNRFFRLRKP